ncbi:hypothetical protein ARMSODRAFT_1016931 [Armillaria solidipes]|uniref:Uncharacterized protein n=1 Tax=Armillaria solidipes TaxID=1076256 RepID=A0A2H3BY86_9AGAR|nr:hypothetical protein ARMSODRAFT_1016931 [Armillaria solidipes]
MSSADDIDQARSIILLDCPLYLCLTNVRQLWSIITAKLWGYKIDGMETYLDLFWKEVQSAIDVRSGTVASTLADCQHYRMRATLLADELLANRSYVFHLDEARRVAAIHIDDMQGHITRLLAAVKPEWRLVEAEVTCLCCFRKLWHAVW